ncbi:MAG: peptidoglycan-associated lipoprotein Pal [bacterium]
MRYGKIAIFAVLFVVVALAGCGKKQVKTSDTGLDKIKMEEVEVKEMARDATPEQPVAIKKIEEIPQMKDAYFEFDSSNLTEQAREALAENAKWIKKNNKLRVMVEGHCDERGTIEYNLALGQRRATSVRNYLVSLGINADKVNTISYGEEKPVDASHNEAAWAKNRRAHIVSIIEK